PIALRAASLTVPLTPHQSCQRAPGAATHPAGTRRCVTDWRRWLDGAAWASPESIPHRCCCSAPLVARRSGTGTLPCRNARVRSEEHTSELQSRFDLVCRLLL